MPNCTIKFDLTQYNSIKKVKFNSYKCFVDTAVRRQCEMVVGQETRFEDESTDQFFIEPFTAASAHSAINHNGLSVQEVAIIAG